MAENTKIEWADHTFNPWIGCSKVSPACDHCYAEADFATRRKVVQWGAGQPRKHTAPSTWAMPLRWNAEAERLGVRYRVFCASLADVFDNEVPTEWRNELFELIKITPHLDWLLLTKRIGNAEKMIWDARLSLVGSTRLITPEVLPNVWIGASITSQAEADRDIPKLLAVPAAKRFLSMEPLLGPVDLRFHIFSEPTGAWRTKGGKRQMELRRPADGGLHWVIVGGESGPNARPMHPDWARSLRDQCQFSGVPFMFKQWGEWISAEQEGCPSGPPLSRWMWADGKAFESGDDRGMPLFCRAGKKAAGRLLDGRTWDEVPA